MSKDPIPEIKQKILESRKIAVASHLRPDGDSICTSLALYFMGRMLDKEMSIFIRDRIPFPFNHYPDIDRIRIGQIPPTGFDCVILLECANVGRSGQDHLGEYYKINIDHHHSNDFYGDLNWVEPEAPAVACLAFKLGEALNIEFTPKIATQLYSGVVSDTGSFQFSNTTARAFDISRRLVEYGAEPFKVTELLFNNNPPEKIKLLGLVLSTLQMSAQRNIAIITMFKHYLDDLHLKEIDTEEITTLARSIKGAQMVLFFKEVKNEVFRVSVRSKGRANSAAVAEHFGGGGHLHAAGFTVTGPYRELIKTVPAKVDELLQDMQASPKME